MLVMEVGPLGVGSGHGAVMNPVGFRARGLQIKVTKDSPAGVAQWLSV